MATTTTADINAGVRLWAGVRGGPSHGMERLRVEVRTMGAEAWEAIHASEGWREWAAVHLEDGRVLAVRAVDDFESKGQDQPETPERIATLRRFRARLFDYLEDAPEVGYLDVQAGGNGSATYRIAVEGEPDGHGRTVEHLAITLGSDPDNP